MITLPRSPCSEGAILSSVSWSENYQAGHLCVVQNTWPSTVFFSRTGLPRGDLLGCHGSQPSRELPRPAQGRNGIPSVCQCKMEIQGQTLNFTGASPMLTIGVQLLRSRYKLVSRPVIDEGFSQAWLGLSEDDNKFLIKVWPLNILSRR